MLVSEMTTTVLAIEWDRLYNDLVNGVGDSRSNLSLILEIERELTRREEQ